MDGWITSEFYTSKTLENESQSSQTVISKHDTKHYENYSTLTKYNISNNEHSLIRSFPSTFTFFESSEFCSRA